MFSLNNKTVLITGASSGIGYELARLFARNKYNLVLVARNLSRLNQMAQEFSRDFGISSKVISKDLSEPSASSEIFKELESASIHLDILVNNAGFGIYGLFWETDLKAERDLIEVNVASVTQLTRLFLPEMIRKKSGKILNVASTAAFQPGPLMATYFASKAYVLFFSEALANELKGTGITVTALCPGPTQTDFQRRSKTENIREGSLGLMKADQVAKAGYEGLMKGTVVVIPGFLNKFTAFIIRFLPRNFVTKLVRWVEEGSL